MTLGSLNLILIFASFILNSFVLFICLRSKRLRTISTFKILSFSSVNDIIACLAWNFSDFTSSVFSWRPYEHSMFFCRFLAIFSQYSSISLISWLLVTISLDRLLSMTLRKWSNIYFNSYKPLIFSSCLTFTILVINFNQVFTIGGVFNVNETEKLICYISNFPDIDWYRINSQVYPF